MKIMNSFFGYCMELQGEQPRPDYWTTGKAMILVASPTSDLETVITFAKNRVLANKK